MFTPAFARWHDLAIPSLALDLTSPDRFCRQVNDYEEQLKELRKEVANIQDIADSLPTECYARVKLEP